MTYGRAIAIVIAAGSALGAMPGEQAPAVLFENARLITGSAAAPIERSAFLVQDSKVVAVGASGEVTAPAGTRRVDLTGKTVMPALINLHGDVGFQRGDTYVAENYTRANILDHLQRYAYYGVPTVVSMGTDAGNVPAEIRGDQAAGRVAGAALLRHAGRGFALPNAGPGAAAMRAAPFGVTSASTTSARSPPASTPTSSSSTPIRSTRSGTPDRSRRCICAAQPSIARRRARGGTKSRRRQSATCDGISER